MIEGRQRTLYGRRRGKKLRAGQEALLGTLLPKLLIEVPPEPQKLDLAESPGDHRRVLAVLAYLRGAAAS